MDQASDQLAAKKPNFSLWVRDQLKSTDQEYQNSHVTLTVFRERGICNPNAAPRCNICFPHGRPTIINIKRWNMKEITNSELKDTVIPISTTIPTAVTTIDKKTPFTPVLRERKYVRRFLKAVWSWI